MKLHFGDLTLEGESRAGSGTWFRVFPPGLALDTGRGALPLAGAGDLFLSHGHLDHSLGVPFVLSQRTLHHSEPTRVFCPAEIAADLEAFTEAAARLERVEYRYQVVGLEPGQRVSVGKGVYLEAFATDHGVPTLGCHLLRRKHHLAAAYRDLPGPEIAALRRQGVKIAEEEEERLLSYCGDTGPGVFDAVPEVLTARLLLVECTFLGEDTRERARRYRHLHLDDLAARACRFENEAVVLHHLSRRHRPEDLRRQVDERLGELASRVHLVGEE